MHRTKDLYIFGISGLSRGTINRTESGLFFRRTRKRMTKPIHRPCVRIKKIVCHFMKPFEKVCVQSTDFDLENNLLRRTSITYFPDISQDPLSGDTQ